MEAVRLELSPAVGRWAPAITDRLLLSAAADRLGGRDRDHVDRLGGHAAAGYPRRLGTVRGCPDRRDVRLHRAVSRVPQTQARRQTWQCGIWRPECHRVLRRDVLTRADQLVRCRQFAGCSLRCLGQSDAVRSIP